jgi:hypothetical protein
MAIPSSNDPKWRDIILGNQKIEFEFLALKFFIGQVQIRLAESPSEEQVQTEVENLRKIFVEGEGHPKVAADLKKIF